MRELGRTVVHENPWYRIVRHDVVDPTGQEHEYFVVDKRDFVVVAAQNKDGQVALVDLYRVPIGRRSLELPAGGVDRGEKAMAAAGRELEEEVGVRAGRLEAIATLDECNGISPAQFHVFLATDLAPGQLDRDVFEADMTVRWAMPTEIDLMMGRAIIDSPTIAAWTLLRRRLV